MSLPKLEDLTIHNDHLWHCQEHHTSHSWIEFDCLLCKKNVTLYLNQESCKSGLNPEHFRDILALKHRIETLVSHRGPLLTQVRESQQALQELDDEQALLNRAIKVLQDNMEVKK